MEYMKHEAWGQTYDLCVEINEYAIGHGMALQLYCMEDGESEPYADLTVNLPSFLTGKNRAFIDTNNMPEAEDLIRNYKLGNPTGRVGVSGYCRYPEYEFDMAEVNRYCVNPVPERDTGSRKTDFER